MKSLLFLSIIVSSMAALSAQGEILCNQSWSNPRGEKSWVSLNISLQNGKYVGTLTASDGSTPEQSDSYEVKLAKSPSSPRDGSDWTYENFEFKLIELNADHKGSVADHGYILRLKDGFNRELLFKMVGSPFAGAPTSGAWIDSLQINLAENACKHD